MQHRTHIAKNGFPSVNNHAQQPAAQFNSSGWLIVVGIFVCLLLHILGISQAHHNYLD